MNNQFDKNYIVDSHCHLDLISQKYENIDQIIQNALDNDVRILQTICTRISKFEDIYKYVRKYKNIFASIGNHPCNVVDEKLATSQEIVKICQSYKKISCGQI